MVVKCDCNIEYEYVTMISTQFDCTYRLFHEPNIEDDSTKAIKI